MRDVLAEVLRDIVYYALRQVLRDCGVSTSTLRKAYDVVYYQAGDAYYTFYLYKDIDGLYVMHVREQYYNGDIKWRNDFKYSKEESRIIDLMNHLHFYVTEVFFH